MAILEEKMNTNEWITDRLPTFDDQTYGWVIVPQDISPYYRSEYWSSPKLGEPWHPVLVMPPYVPKKKLRPWTPEEAIGKVVRGKITRYCWVVVYAGGDSVAVGTMKETMSMDLLLRSHEQLNGDPCGVEE